MTALFAPLWFTAHSGSVHFEGYPLSELTAVRAGVAIRRACLDAPIGKAWIYHVAHEQLFAAQAEARAQRHDPMCREPSPTAAAPMGVVNSHGPQAASAPGRESAR